jgi:hypothetical protein
MISTCLLNPEATEFSAKESTVSVVIYIEGVQKLFGSLTLNLCSVLSPKNYQERGGQLIEQELNGRAKSKILLKLTSNYINEMLKNDDQQSIGSGIHSVNYNNAAYGTA